MAIFCSFFLSAPPHPSRLTPPTPRLDHTVVGDDDISAFVRMYGAPSPEEAREGRVYHEVGIKLKANTRSLDTTPVIEQFKYTCNCQAKCAWCIHIVLVMITQFTT